MIGSFFPFRQPPQVLDSFTIHSQRENTKCVSDPSEIAFRVVFKKENKERKKKRPASLETASLEDYKRPAS